MICGFFPPHETFCFSSITPYHVLTQFLFLRQIIPLMRNKPFVAVCFFLFSSKGSDYYYYFFFSGQVLAFPSTTLEFLRIAGTRFSGPCSCRLVALHLELQADAFPQDITYVVSISRKLLVTVKTILLLISYLYLDYDLYTEDLQASLKTATSSSPLALYSFHSGHTATESRVGIYPAHVYN